jgi:hypothetical protein
VRKVEAGGRKVIMPRDAMHFSSSPWPMLCVSERGTRLTAGLAIAGLACAGLGVELAVGAAGGGAQGRGRA